MNIKTKFFLLFLMNIFFCNVIMAQKSLYPDTAIKRSNYSITTDKFKNVHVILQMGDSIKNSDPAGQIRIEIFNSHGQRVSFLENTVSRNRNEEELSYTIKIPESATYEHEYYVEITFGGKTYHEEIDFVE